MKKLIETRNQKLSEMDALLDAAKNENRAFTPEEKERFDALEAKVKALKETIDAQQRRTAATATDPDPAAAGGEGGESEEEKKKAENEERAFGNYIRGIVETRAEVNMTEGANGAVIPTTVANKIIEMVYDISPIVKLASRYVVAGNLVIPYYDEKAQKITVAYADEFSELESTSGKFASIELKDFLAGALTKVSKTLLRKSKFNLTAFVTRKMAEDIVRWLEREVLMGTKDKITGMDVGVTQIVTTEAVGAITADELIDTQDEVPDIFQENAIWIMNRKTRKAIRKLKDNDKNYLLNRDLTAKWGYTLLGKDVYTTDSVPAMVNGKTAVFYGDMSGLAVKISEEMNIQVLREKYATQHAIGVVGYIAADAKVEHTQKLSKLVMKAEAAAAN